MPVHVAELRENRNDDRRQQQLGCLEPVHVRVMDAEVDDDVAEERNVVALDDAADEFDEDEPADQPCSDSQARSAQPVEGGCGGHARENSTAAAPSLVRGQPRGEPVTTERETLTWQGFGDAARELSRTIVADGFMPDVVVAIARGGLLPAGAIAYGLGIKNCGAINVEFYTGIGTVLPDPELLPPEMDMAYLDGRRVLLVDDVADSGRTLDLAVRLLTDRGAIVRSVVIYTKPTTIIRPDWSWKDTDLWIDFPWSWQGSVIEQDAAVRESA